MIARSRGKPILCSSKLTVQFYHISYHFDFYFVLLCCRWMFCFLFLCNNKNNTPQKQIKTTKKKYIDFFHAVMKTILFEKNIHKHWKTWKCSFVRLEKGNKFSSTKYVPYLIKKTKWYREVFHAVMKTSFFEKKIHKYLMKKKSKNRKF